MRASIVIRTYNEERYLGELLGTIRKQSLGADAYEVILVDSGSTDRTVAIAEECNAQVLRIAKDEFSFGRSLNLGCARARGDVLVFVSGHCIPTDEHWLEHLIRPVEDGRAVYISGRQIGGPATRFSEHQLFRKHFPDQNRIPQSGFFVNNANAALAKRTWEQTPFDEDLTGLEDLHLAKQLTSRGEHTGYVAESAVYHMHHETWAQVRRRFEREAIALQRIMPEIHVSIFDFLRYFSSAVLFDWSAAMDQKRFVKHCGEIVAYRFVQFWGSYRGNHEHRKLSRKAKELYFYPNKGISRTDHTAGDTHGTIGRPSPNESSQRAG